jgi:two-component system response regulator ChvI
VVNPMSMAEQQTSSPPPVDDKLIYVVDDESMIGDVVQIILKLDGFKPRFFTDPEEALRAMMDETAKPVLLLTDFVMSPMNGIELIQRCKQDCPQLKTILYSGNAGEDIFVHAAVKPDAFLRKPFLPRTLLNLVRSTLP